MIFGDFLLKGQYFHVEIVAESAGEAKTHEEAIALEPRGIGVAETGEIAEFCERATGARATKG